MKTLRNGHAGGHVRAVFCDAVDAFATAQRAAFTLFAQKGSAIWRRFMVIAFEDLGAASPDAVAHDRRGEYGLQLA